MNFLSIIHSWNFMNHILSDVVTEKQAVFILIRSIPILAYEVIIICSGDNGKILLLLFCMSF